MTDASHTPAAKPSALLALIALGIVFRFQPAWLVVDLQSAAAEHGVRPDRLSRLTSRALAPFEQLVARLTRRGRPVRDAEQDATRTELALLRELLGVARGLLAHVKLHRRKVGELVVGAFERLREQHGISQHRFCALLGIPERTLRHWRSRPTSTTTSPSSTEPPATREPRAKPARARAPRRGRFGFDMLLPGTQVGADTTDLVAFDVPLKLVAAQDVGGRDDALFESIVVDDHESANIVATVMSAALADKPGAQAITDQGTPYLARFATGALEALDVEHAPQREGDPLGKATVERAFGTIKRIAGPLFELTNRIARAVPELACPTLAKALATLLITAQLRSYQAGARAGRAAATARAGIDADELARRAEQSRERARSTDRSARLLLAHIHELYSLGGSQRDFTNSLRRYPLQVLHDAEREFAAQCHRDDIRDRKSYYASIVRRLNDEHTRRRRIAQQDAEDNAALHGRAAAHHAQQRALLADPIAWLRFALDLIAMHWIPSDHALLFGGDGFGLGHLQAALVRLALVHGAAATDVARGTLHEFRLGNADRLGPDGVDAVSAVLERELGKLDAKLDCAAESASAIFRSTGRSPRPPPPNRLRI
jgi:hypothetical protein